MEDQTRQLLSLLADRVAAGLLEALADGPLDEAALRSKVRGSRQTINRRLDDLERWGLVTFDEPRADRPGRPARSWALRDTRLLRVANAADALALELLEERAAIQREGIEERRRREIRATDASAG